jgi:DNA-directed RNA polymerase sigma subunit (sigma70/sigma32)
MTDSTFLAILDAVRNVDALDAWAASDSTRAALIERSAPIWTDSIAVDSSDAELVERAFAAVDPLEERVCRVSYGFEDYEPQPDLVVAERVGLSRQKTQRTRSAALGKMRAALGA